MMQELRLSPKKVARNLGKDEKTIRDLAREAVNRNEGVERPVLRCRSTVKPLVDADGFAYVVVDVAPNRKGRPAITRGEKKWSFIRIEQPQGYTTLAERYLLPGTALWGTGTSRVVKAVVCEAGIVPGSPERILDDYAPSEIAHVIAANEPGPILGILSFAS